MQYDGYAVGSVLRSLRLERKLSKEELSHEIGISVSAIKQYENGGRTLSMVNLFRMIEYFGVDANTILNVTETETLVSIDERLKHLDSSKREYFQKSFLFMLDNAALTVL
jgi:transcriptional regulator with XRE-family HTH domain